MQLRTEAYPVKTICEVLGLPRSSFYHQPETDENAGLCGLLHDLAAQYPTYGYRRLTALVRRQGWWVNHKRVQRLIAEMGLQRSVKRRQRRTTDSHHAFWRYPNLVASLEVTYPDQVWVADSTYVALRDEVVYLAVIMDVYTRAIRGWHLSRSLDRELTLTALRYWVGSTPNARNAPRQAASDSISLKGVLPIRASAACCSARYATCNGWGDGPLRSPRARMTPPAR